MEALRNSGERRSDGRLTLIAVHVKDARNGAAACRIDARNRRANTDATAPFWK